MKSSTGFADLTMDIVSGKCHVFSNRYGRHESIYCSDNAFEALNYIVEQDNSFSISDTANLWIDIEAHEDLMRGIKEHSSLFGMCA
jgi:hypothetical protein